MTSPLASPTSPTTHYTEEQRQAENKFQYLYLNISTAFYEALQSNACDCVAVATKVLVLTLPIIFVLEVILDLAAFPFFWIANYICQDSPQMAQPRLQTMTRPMSPTPISTLPALNHPLVDVASSPPISQSNSPLLHSEEAPPAPQVDSVPLDPVETPPLQTNEAEALLLPPLTELSDPIPGPEEEPAPQLPEETFQLQSSDAATSLITKTGQLFGDYFIRPARRMISYVSGK